MWGVEIIMQKKGGKSVHSWLWPRIVVRVFAQMITVRAGCKLSLDKWTGPYSTTKGPEHMANGILCACWEDTKYVKMVRL